MTYPNSSQVYHLLKTDLIASKSFHHFIHFSVVDFTFFLDLQSWNGRQLMKLLKNRTYDLHFLAWNFNSPSKSFGSSHAHPTPSFKSFLPHPILHTFMENFSEICMYYSLQSSEFANHIQYQDQQCRWKNTILHTLTEVLALPSILRLYIAELILPIPHFWTIWLVAQAFRFHISVQTANHLIPEGLPSWFAQLSKVHILLLFR